MTRFFIAVSFFVGHGFTVSHAFEGDLILPTTGKSTIEFEMRSEQEDIRPADVFLVYVGSRDDCCAGKSPIAGHFAMDERTVTFVPAFDFIEGQIYTVKVRAKDATINDARSIKEFTIERTLQKVSPEIVAVFPSGKYIPENTLRFYIHFSTPMRPHVSSDYIKLVNATTGMADTAAFMGFKQELWSEDRKRLTLLMDPGRIKRGVAQNMTLGPALRVGSTYSIVIDEGWPTANDAETMPGYASVFTASKALRTIPDPALWTITSPRNLTSDPLVIEFDRPFDHELLQSTISVQDEDGRLILGEITIEKQERIWRFKPSGEWSSSRIQILIDTKLEDVAGNNFIELLDHSVGAETSITNQKGIVVDLTPSPN